MRVVEVWWMVLSCCTSCRTLKKSSNIIKHPHLFHQCYSIPLDPIGSIMNIHHSSRCRLIHPFHASRHSLLPLTPIESPRSPAAASSSTASAPRSSTLRPSPRASRSFARSGAQAARRLGARAPWQSEAKALPGEEKRCGMRWLQN